MWLIDKVKSFFKTTPNEILELKKIIEKVVSEREQLQKDLDVLLARKRTNKRTLANARRKLTRTKNEVKKMETAFKNEDVDDAVKFLRKFSKLK
jgi:uncharacterized protein YwgA|tara:strand:- start:188 stop:469 length:282 start_codon:yes stop_codon:yes gene_type:complete